VLTKPTEGITADDLAQLVSNRIAEAGQLDYKLTLASPTGSVEPWTVGFEGFAPKC